MASFGGYDSGSWSGYLYKFVLDLNTAVDPTTAPNGDAGCTLTGKRHVHSRGLRADHDHTAERLMRRSRAAASLFGYRARYFHVDGQFRQTRCLEVPFAWCVAEQWRTRHTWTWTRPRRIRIPPVPGDAWRGNGNRRDGNGTDRVSIICAASARTKLRPTTETKPRQFRIRKSLLGPVINSQSTYEAGPGGGFSDLYPAGSPEQIAAAPCTAGLTATGCNSYEKYVKDNTTTHPRPPVVYVGANDGMLHAFDASGTTTTDGKELWAFVPNILYSNGQLGQLTNTTSTLTTTVDDTPVIQDAFIPTPSDLATTKWRTILIGSLRLGGRGIYALDISDQTQRADDTQAAASG